MSHQNAQTRQHGFLLYSRKSTEAEDRQVLSIVSQTDEMHEVAERQHFPILEVLSEARSAKEPGRPVFNEMMKRLEAGEAEGILCWKLDRLARNPVDGGRLIWAVRQHGIRIITPTQTYSHEDDNMILMYIEFGMAHKYIDDLGRAVKRGLRAKAERGIYPGGAPSGTHLGYHHDATQPKGRRGLVKDTERFLIVRRLWDLMLTGSYSVTNLVAIANHEWGFRTRNDAQLSRSALYRLFTNPLYYGEFEYPKRSGRWFKGIHEAMITEGEFDSVQTLLGSKGRPRHASRTFGFTGLIRCGECDAMITAEEKRQLICSVCRHKFASRGKDRCPRCHTNLEAMLASDGPRRPKHLRYVYYHCTKQRIPRCTQRAMREEVLERQIATYLARVRMPAALEQWVLTRLRRAGADELESQQAISEARRKAYEACLARLDNLVRLKTSPGNVSGSLLSDEEYARQRAPLLKERAQLELVLNQGERSIEGGIKLLEDIFEFTRQAPVWLSTQDPEAKQLILAVFAGGESNLALADRKLSIHAPKPFPALEEAIAQLPAVNGSIEPEKGGPHKRQKDAFASSRPTECGQRDDVRTCRNHEAFTNGVRRDEDRVYGETGVRFLRSLREWLVTAPEIEFVALRARLDALLVRQPWPRLGKRVV